jgi:hypothetical protein
MKQEHLRGTKSSTFYSVKRVNLRFPVTTASQLIHPLITARYFPSSYPTVDVEGRRRVIELE